jgi:hypothetical protein
LKKTQEHVDDPEAKLKAAEGALEEARARITSDEEKLSKDKSQMASREADIFLRLDTLNASFVSKFEPMQIAISLEFFVLFFLLAFLLCCVVAKQVGDSYEMPNDQRQDPLLDSLTILEAISMWVRNVGFCCRKQNKILRLNSKAKIYYMEMQRNRWDKCSYP